MDLQIYYKKIRELEAALKDPCVVIVSRETPDGGREGVRTEVPRRIAAQMVVEGAVRLATADETREFQEQKLEAKRQAEQLAAASKVQIAVMPASDIRRLRNQAAGNKD